MTAIRNRIFDWFAIFVVVMIGAFTAAIIPQDRWDWSTRRLSGVVAWFGHGFSRHTSEIPEVLIVSRQADDRFAVASTLEPRGYQIVVAQDAEAALAELRAHPARIGWVIVDEAQPDSRRTLAAAETLSPDACPILLKGRRDPAQIARILVEAMDRHLTPVQARQLQQESLLDREAAKP